MLSVHDNEKDWRYYSKNRWSGSTKSWRNKNYLRHLRNLPCEQPVRIISAIQGWNTFMYRGVQVNEMRDIVTIGYPNPTAYSFDVMAVVSRYRRNSTSSINWNVPNNNVIEAYI